MYKMAGFTHDTLRYPKDRQYSSGTFVQRTPQTHFITQAVAINQILACDSMQVLTSSSLVSGESFAMLTKISCLLGK